MSESAIFVVGRRGVAASLRLTLARKDIRERLVVTKKGQHAFFGIWNRSKTKVIFATPNPCAKPNQPNPTPANPPENQHNRDNFVKIEVDIRKSIA